MRICSDGHDEICFEGRDCPFCDYISEITIDLKSLEQRVEDNEKKISKLEEIAGTK